MNYYICEAVKEMMNDIKLKGEMWAVTGFVKRVIEPKALLRCNY